MIKELEKVIKKLEEGVGFKETDLIPLPTFKVKAGRTIYRVKYIKLLKYSYSKKSADIKVIFEEHIWDPEELEMDIHPFYSEVIWDVRMAFIIKFLSYNLDRLDPAYF